MALRNPTSNTTAQVPRVGMIATVRNRRGVVSGVRPHDGLDGRLHLVDLEFNDGDHPMEETILWEREPFAQLQRPAALPDPLSSEPMKAEDLLAPRPGVSVVGAQPVHRPGRFGANGAPAGILAVPRSCPDRGLPANAIAEGSSDAPRVLAYLPTT